DLRAVASEGRQPVLAIWGSDDAIIPARHAEGLPAQVEIIPGQAHMVQMEAAEQVNRLLLDFLRQH
ncbi:acetoin dehydrogenase dihydrolipoyllysine-residue acetyltransferase subunit, partial [Pseudomonas aeruginosa]